MRQLFAGSFWVFFQHVGDLRARKELLVQELKLLGKAHRDKLHFCSRNHAG